MSEIKVIFEELPIVVDLGFEAGLVDGTATIAYERDGTWFIRELALDGYRPHNYAGMSATHEVFERKSVIIDRASYSWLYAAICDQLENGRFKDQVADAIEEDRAACAEDHADQQREQRRDDRAEQSTRT